VEEEGVFVFCQRQGFNQHTQSTYGLVLEAIVVNRVDSWRIDDTKTGETTGNWSLYILLSMLCLPFWETIERQ
jgi:hypothetical protein